MIITEDVAKGQAIYNRTTLKLYDFWVLGLSNYFIWKCPTQNILNHFNANISSNHLDIGVGSGFFLDKCTFPTKKIRIGLMDINQHSLDVAAKRITRYSPVKYKVNILDKINLKIEKFDSISLNYLFHCLPGKLTEKLTVLENIDFLIKQNGTIFGSTILGKNIKTNIAATKLMDIYNKKGIFSNKEDSYDQLKEFLAKRYAEYTLRLNGCVAFFTIKNLS